MLAGLFYLGSGAGLFLLRLLRRETSHTAEAQLSRKDAPWLAGAILSGGVVGPVLLMWGLTLTPASTASLLLTLEGVATALIAWFAFHENFDRRIALGMAAIVAGAAVLSWPQSFDLGDSRGPLLIAAACVAWGIDNNLTRKVALADPTQSTMIKGLVAGSVNFALAFWSGANLPQADVALLAGVIGFFGYGLSIVLFILALRGLGTARTGAYFSTAPFLGAVVAIPLLGEGLSPQLALAGILMAAGVWLHLTERHEHEHEHDDMEHTHSHVHDQHHRHVHILGDPPGEPHTHRHAHTRLRHSHVHTPDSHHRHSH